GTGPWRRPRPLPPLYGGFTHSVRTAKFWARYRGKPIVLAANLEFCQKLWAAYRDEAEKHGHQVQPGDEAGWGGLMICGETDAEAEEWMQDMAWFWDKWSMQFGQGLPMLLVGSADTI